jgi:hypothetical protein
MVFESYYYQDLPCFERQIVPRLHYLEAIA